MLGLQGSPKFKKAVVCACACVYFIWKARNAGYWSKCVPTVDATVKQLKSAIKKRVRVPRNLSVDDCSWFHRL